MAASFWSHSVFSRRGRLKRPADNCRLPSQETYLGFSDRTFCGEQKECEFPLHSNSSRNPARFVAGGRSVHPTRRTDVMRSRFLVFATLAVAGCGYAQTRLRGIVKDPQGRPVADAQVRL